MLKSGICNAASCVGVQAFYAEFGELMMRQPVIGLDFQSYLPIAIVPYMLLLAFNVFNRYGLRALGLNDSSPSCPLPLYPTLLTIFSVLNRYRSVTAKSGPNACHVFGIVGTYCSRLACNVASL